MATVGVRKFKAHLSDYLHRARSGERVVVTDRGRPVAVVGPATGAHASTRLQELLRKGLVKWDGGRPTPSKNPPRVRRGTVANAVVRGRR